MSFSVCNKSISVVYFFCVFYSDSSHNVSFPGDVYCQKLISWICVTSWCRSKGYFYINSVITPLSIFYQSHPLQPLLRVLFHVVHIRGTPSSFTFVWTLWLCRYLSPCSSDPRSVHKTWDSWNLKKDFCSPLVNSLKLFKPPPYRHSLYTGLCLNVRLLV